VDAWNNINNDPKLDIFIEKLNDTLPKINKQQKLVLFSESKRVRKLPQYISNKIKESGIDKILTIDSSNRNNNFPEVKANFDANIPLDQQKDEY